MFGNRIFIAFIWLLFSFNLLYAQSLDMETITSYPFPSELTSAATGSRIALAINERGKRNIYVAEGPDFQLRKLTAYDQDNGDEITSVCLSFDGQRVVYVKGGDHGAYDESVPRNPSSLPLEPKVQIWSIPFAGGTPVLLADGDYPVLSPDGKTVVFAEQGQIWRAPVDGSQKAKRLFFAKGQNSSPKWSPDGSQLVFVSSRKDHALIGIYRDEQTPIRWIAPTFSRDASPRWSPDGKKLAFIRMRPSGGAPDSLTVDQPDPWAIWIADLSTGEAKERWKSPVNLRGSIPNTNGSFNLHWAAKDRIVFLSNLDGWPHLYSMPAEGGQPLLLTPGHFMAEHIGLSPDKCTLVFSANTGPDKDDIDRRHIVSVPVDKAKLKVLTPGSGLETFPVFTGDGQRLALVSATAVQPGIPAILNLSGDKKLDLIGRKLIPETLAKTPQVVPTRVEFKAADGGTVYGQLFEPKEGLSKKPAVLFIHGGPSRQMLLGWNYGDYYSNTYALNQYLVSRGFVVLSVNYRLGIGYGTEFHNPPAAGRYGASEYLDVKAAGEWLAAQPQVDAGRIGVYGGSYGGFLTALALGRDSRLFAAGVDVHGVHNFMGRVSVLSAEPAPDKDLAIRLAKESSPVSYVDSWTSPVLFIHGDDDGNVDFHETIDLLNRLGKKQVDIETLMVPDETHHWLKYEHQVMVDQAIADFLEKKLLKKII
ncbi:Dipeptidyl aminopeptidase/acylaminoacyl peptidase [bacterium A37T11]|nr:Dipeptidyl aminopeptidase/acylaminoacyl peptidase [bacterium A37T11]